MAEIDERKRIAVRVILHPLDVEEMRRNRPPTLTGEDLDPVDPRLAGVPVTLSDFQERGKATVMYEPHPDPDGRKLAALRARIERRPISLDNPYAIRIIPT